MVMASLFHSAFRRERSLYIFDDDMRARPEYFSDSLTVRLRC